MNEVSTRVNGQSVYQPVAQARQAWREEMLDQILNRMRDQKTAQQLQPAPVKEAAIPGKGSFVDVYV